MVELCVILVLFTMIFGIVLSFMAYSNRSWNLGRNKVIEQAQARQAVDSISMLLRQASPRWTIAGNNYDIDINAAGNQLIFYRPVFDASSNITGLVRVKIYLNPLNNTQLLKMDGTDPAVPIATNISGVSFGPNPMPADITTLQAVTMSISTLSGSGYTLSSQVNLRNYTSILPPSTTVEEPPAGGDEGAS